MRVSRSKIQRWDFPARLICFCKKPSPPPPPSPSHIYAAAPPPLIESDDDGGSSHRCHPCVAPPPPPRSAGGDGGEAIQQCTEGTPVENKPQPAEPPRPGNVLKSSLRRKGDSSESKFKSNGVQIKKKRVQWIDFLGKELVEIKEFESSEAGDSDDEDISYRGCLCHIL
ncbi:hypothetical protein Dimus_021357 [Dionaea muscipula]